MVSEDSWSVSVRPAGDCSEALRVASDVGLLLSKNTACRKAVLRVPTAPAMAELSLAHRIHLVACRNLTQ